MKAIITLVFLSALLAVAISHNKNEEKILKMQNKYREKHQVGPLKLSDKLIKDAKKCAKYYASIRAVDHTCPEAQKYGENLYDYTGGDIPQTDEDAIKGAAGGWYSEVSDYDDYEDPSEDQVGATLHFTQLVWKDTTEFGVGIARDSDKNVYLCGLYNPQGNMQDLDSSDPYSAYKVNVLPPA